LLFVFQVTNEINMKVSNPFADWFSFSWHWTG
jgi:hypothetical protein